MTNSADGLSWAVDTPVGASPRKDGAAEVLGLRVGVGLRHDKEHLTAAVMGAGPDQDTGGGEHRPGSAVAYLTSTEPTDRPDGLVTIGTGGVLDKGRLWVDTTTGHVMKVYDGSDFQNVSGVSQISGNLTVASLVAGPVTIVVGFIPDIIHCMYGVTSFHNFSAMPASLDPIRVREFTTANQQDWEFTVVDTDDISIERITGSITPTGTFYWRALKF